MLEEYKDLPDRYRAQLNGTELLFEVVTPHIYRRVGTAGTGATKREAGEVLKRNITLKFTQEIGAIDFQFKYNHISEG